MARKDAVGPWATDKLDALRKYLDAYTTIMRKQACIRGYHYIDGFAGLSRWRIKDSEQFIDGSPRVALTAKHPFHSYTFIELDHERVQRLEKLQTEYPDRDIRILHGDANRRLVEDVAPRIRYADYQRAVAFLDPYGMELEFSTLQVLASTRAIEAFVNVPTMALNRDAPRNDARDIPPPAAERMDRFWGGPAWREAFYEAEGTGQHTLFGEVLNYKIRTTTARRLGERYKQRLKDAGFGFVAENVGVVRNVTKQPIYCLVFAGPNETGGKICDRILGGMGVYLNAIA